LFDKPAASGVFPGTNLLNPANKASFVDSKSGEDDDDDE